MSERKGTKALELWCKRILRNYNVVQIENMTTSWRNGLAFCVLVHHFRPDLINIKELKAENIYENNKLAFTVAEKCLGIPALLDPEDMVATEIPDRLSVLTYLSQFYQRLGHTINVSSSDNDQPTSPLASSSSTQSTEYSSFSKINLDKCTACGENVYLAQRLIVSSKLYHRRCFRCSKCFGHISPTNAQYAKETELICDTCKHEVPKTLENIDQMGMLAYRDDTNKTEETVQNVSLYSEKKSRPLSILEKISIFENNSEKDVKLDRKMSDLSLKNDQNNDTVESQITSESEGKLVIDTDSTKCNMFTLSEPNKSEKVYKSNMRKLDFLQTQLANDALEIKICDKELDNKESATDNTSNKSTCVLKEESNATDDSRLASNQTTLPKMEFSCEDNQLTSSNNEDTNINVPPRRKRQSALIENTVATNTEHENSNEDYPDHLNPFSDEEETEDLKDKTNLSTNPFGCSDEETDDLPPVPVIPNISVKSALPAAKTNLNINNPFWSDGEEPSDDETQNKRWMTQNGSLTTSTPNISVNSPRKKKRAPPPPTIAALAPKIYDLPSTSMDDITSISSLSSCNSSAQLDQKSPGRATPLKKKAAPNPPENTSGFNDSSSCKSVDTTGGSTRKRAAPGLPLPARRQVATLSAEELQTQLQLLETQQLGLERQGVLVEQLIRDKCEGEEANSVPQEEVEDLVIQLCELVNEKNDLFRKQTELMYIRRQQRLEQEQADIEHEIRIIQSRPTVNRIDADKVREEQLVARLVQIVSMRDELVQQIDAERRREQQEDLAIAKSIATRRAQRNSDSNTSTQTSLDVTLPKKNKVKDKVKKHLKKAKHTLITKKKDENVERKPDKIEKEKKIK